MLALPSSLKVAAADHFSVIFAIISACTFIERLLLAVC